MNHQYGRSKLNVKPSHKRALLRNQAIHFIKNGALQSTKARVKEVQRLIEKTITIARKGYDFNTIRRVKKILPYDQAMVEKLIKEIAPKYVNQPGGYTRIIPMGRRMSDTSQITRLEWV